MRRYVVLVVLLSAVGCSRPAAPRRAEPKPVEQPSPLLATVTFPCGETTLSGFLCHPRDEGKYAGVLMIPDRMGLNEGIKRQALRLAQEGYVVLVVDPYRGETPRTVQEAERLEGELPKARVLGDLKAAVDYLSGRDDVRKATLREGDDVSKARLGVLGFGLGGGYALETALADPRPRAVVVCYSPLPSDPKRLASLKATVMCILAGKDKSVTVETIEPFRKAMVESGKTLEGICVYRECSHGFLDSAEWPVYGEPPLQDVVDAWKLIARYLDKQLN